MQSDGQTGGVQSYVRLIKEYDWCQCKIGAGPAWCIGVVKYLYKGGPVNAYNLNFQPADVRGYYRPAKAVGLYYIVFAFPSDGQTGGVQSYVRLIKEYDWCQCKIGAGPAWCFQPADVRGYYRPAKAVGLYYIQST